MAAVGHVILLSIDGLNLRVLLRARPRVDPEKGNSI
jgi:hypothetical protein